MTTDLAGRRVMVTGGTSGIGHAIARALVAANARVILTGRDENVARETAVNISGGSYRPEGIALDVRDESSVAAAVRHAREALGGLDVLVNNAGLGVRSINERYLSAPENFWEIPYDRFCALVETNIGGYFLCARAVVPQMLSAGFGRIINISINEGTMSRAHFIPYGPSRAASDAMTYAMAAELEGTGVTVNLVAPGGATATRMITEEAGPAFRAQLIDPAVIGPVACWLASDASVEVNGQKLVASEFSPP